MTNGMGWVIIGVGPKSTNLYLGVFSIIMGNIYAFLLSNHMDLFFILVLEKRSALH